MKTYVLTVSRQFPKTHKRAGDPTFFIEKIFSAFGKLVPCEFCFRKDYCGYSQKNCLAASMNFDKKLHTIRANYELWKKRAEEINEGKAILSVKYWSGKPYWTKQVEICRLEKIGVQKLDNPANFVWAEIDDNIYHWEDVAKNDGLSFEDFCEWFKDYGSSEPMAIIQFTDFRY